MGRQAQRQFPALSAGHWDSLRLAVSSGNGHRTASSAGMEAAFPTDTGGLTPERSPWPQLRLGCATFVTSSHSPPGLEGVPLFPFSNEGTEASGDPGANGRVAIHDPDCLAGVAAASFPLDQVGAGPWHRDAVSKPGLHSLPSLASLCPSAPSGGGLGGGVGGRGGGKG